MDKIYIKTVVDRWVTIQCRQCQVDGGGMGNGDVSPSKIARRGPDFGGNSIGVRA